MIDRAFLPYARQLVEDDDVAAVVEALRSDYLTTGPRVPAFEEALAREVGAEWAVAVSNGTAALYAACAAAGVKEGDEVIVPAITFVATANCARLLGAEPVFADVDPDTGLVVPESVAGLITGRTRAVMAVHLGGAVADVAALAAITGPRGITLIEDAAHALGARGPAGAVGSCAGGSRMATFSFHPVKQITTGEGGAVTGNDPLLLRHLRLFREHGIQRSPELFWRDPDGPWYYEQGALGHNLRLTDLQAALGTSQLAKLGRFIARRKALAERYDRLLEGVPGVKPVIGPAGRAGAAWHLYQVLIDYEGLGHSRGEVVLRLRERGIGTQVHYIPLPLQPYYWNRGAVSTACPGSLEFYRRTLSLPLFPAMADSDVDRVVEALAGILGRQDTGKEMS